MTLATVHLIIVSFWLGLLAAETALELNARDASSTRTVARVHRWIDLCFEGPTAIAVLVTGGWLMARAWPAPPLVVLHGAAGVVPALVNLLCVGYVLARARTDDESEARALTRKVKLTGYAIPFIFIAMAIGLVFLHPGA
ncbi:MAG TPA: hypothetical protein PK163_10655 [Steroidobacteraceae bacterium]|nr:hypothetical protein [Steroidobacteraceae bacterium]